MNFPQHRYLFLRYIFATVGSLIFIIFTLLQKYLMPGRRYLLESTSPEFIMIPCEIHCPLRPTPSQMGMKCALNRSEIHHMQQQWALALPLFLVWNRYTIFPPDLFRDLHCSFHAQQQLLWTVWVCRSSQMILSFCLKLVLITKAWFYIVRCSGLLIMNYMKVQAPLLLNTFNSRHGTCAGYSQGLGPSNQAFTFLWLSLDWWRRAERHSLFTCFIHFPGRVLFGDTFFFFYMRLYFILKEAFLNITL